MPNYFKNRLQDVLLHFSSSVAMALSDEIHMAESNGYELSMQEDRLWKRLTIRIEAERLIGQNKCFGTYGW